MSDEKSILLVRSRDAVYCVTVKRWRDEWCVLLFLCVFMDWTRSKAEMSDSATVLEAFKFIEKAAAEFSDEDDDDDSEGQNKTIVDLTTVS